MIVAGGTYLERCRSPESYELRGSGLRAGAALVHQVPDLFLHTFIEREGRDLAEVTAGAFGVNVDWRARSHPVEFSYFTPISAPVISGRLARAETGTTVAADAGLVFGMIEGAIPVEARRLVVDPQQPRDMADLDLAPFRWEHLALVANRQEVTALSGTTETSAAARALRERYGAEVVVTKLGGVGLHLSTQEIDDFLGPRPTPSVFPIGTGDAFAAGFAWAWASQGSPPREAARVGTAFAASWAATAKLPVRLDSAAGIDAYHEIAPKYPRVYLAAPFFDLAQVWLVELARTALLDLGASVFSPLHDVGKGGDEVAEADIEGLSDADAVLLLLDGMDPGTVFEGGWALSKGVPCVGYMQRGDPEGLKMLRGLGCEVHYDLSTAVYRAIWAGMEGDLG